MICQQWINVSKKLKSHEIRNLESFCRIMSNYGFSYKDYDSYFVSYSIKQIGKEFDLLRFGDELILNIELKSELKIANKLEKIRKQMEVNHYYLKFLPKFFYKVSNLATSDRYRV